MKLSSEAFRCRRATLLASMEANSVAIIPSAKSAIRSRDTDYHFRQNSDFYYLTGFEEPDALLVLAPGRAKGEFLLFCRERNREVEIWEGLRAGPEGAVQYYFADEAFDVSCINERIPELIDGYSRVYYPIGHDEKFDQQMMLWLNAIRSKARSGARPPEAFSDIGALIHGQRLIKSTDEIAAMRASCELAARVHNRAMQVCKPGVFEYQLEAEILHGFAMEGARFPAYNTIVGGGRNACILHYTENKECLADGDLVLIDAGCELDFYAADITRTFPVNGHFTSEQALLYQLVLDAQKAAIAVIRPGCKWNEPHDVSVRVLTEGLVKLGLLEGEVSKIIEEGGYKRFYMHRVGHWLGIDVHDVGSYKVAGQWRFLEPGMVMTVEPGLYIASDDETVEPRWRGIGIRIEDDVVVTPKGCDILSLGAVKEIAEIEALMSRSKSGKP